MRASSLSSTRAAISTASIRKRLKEGVKRDAKNHSVLVVQRQGRGGGEFLRVDFQEFESHKHLSLWRRRAGPERDGHGREISTRWTGISVAQRRPAIQLLAGHLVCGELRDAERSR